MIDNVIFEKFAQIEKEYKRSNGLYYGNYTNELDWEVKDEKNFSSYNRKK